MFGLVNVTPPASEPVSLSTLKLQCRINVSNEDTLLQQYITVARMRFEALTNVCCVQSQWKMTMDRFSTPYRYGAERADQDWYSFGLYWQVPLYFPKFPLVSVDNFQYLDANNNQQVLDPSNYSVDTSKQPGVLWLTNMPLFPFFFPLFPPFDHPRITITFTGGYGVGQCPVDIQQAILLLAAQYYKDRETLSAPTEDLPHGFLAIVDQYRNFMFSNRGQE